MDIEGGFERKRTGRKIRIRISTNKHIKFITAIKPEATVSDLANRALSAYLELTGQSRLNKGSKKQLTVSAVKQGIFYMPKSEYVVNLLNCDDEVEVVIIKAKPKYPHQIFNPHQLPPKSTLSQNQINPEKVEADENMEVVQAESVQAKADLEEREEVGQNISILQEDGLEKLSKKQKKKQKMKLKKQQTRMMNEENGSAKKVDKTQKNHREVETAKKREEMMVPESSAKKKVKLDKEEAKVFEKLPLIMPSPKITFHNQPKIDSPRVSLLPESIKRKTTPDLPRTTEDKAEAQRLNSPFAPIKSPLVIHRTPVSHQDEARLKNKEELLNFSLPRKFSDEKWVQSRKDKNKQQPSIKKIEQLKDLGGNSSISDLNLQKEVPKPAKVEEVKGVKKAMKIMVVEAEESESEENKQVTNYVHVHHRQKQFNQINNKINSFLLELDDQD